MITDDELENAAELDGDMPCEICGDEYPADSLTRCETCSWLMCESCESHEGNCRDCAQELGLLNEDGE